MRPTSRLVATLALFVSTPATPADPARDYPIRPVPFTDVRITGGLWAARIETNRRATVRYDFGKCEETGRIDNFAKAGGLMEGPFRGIRFDDSDVFKVIEGASYSLATEKDPELDAYLDALIAKIAAAQEEDGYLYTCRTIDPENLPGGTGETRWSFLAHSHELYNVGHLYEAAVAHYLATGKRSLLDVALKNADLVARVFGPDGRRDVPGHQEIEIGLVKLYRVTGERRWLDLAKFFLDERGHARGRSLQGRYSQDHEPVVEQREAVGHAVRAGYMYCGMADVAALTGDDAYVEAIDALWRDVIEGKMYVTGGIGSSRHGEAFGQRFELPNASAYNETCAAIANALWNHRMFLLHGDGKYIDVLERVIYNGFLAGVSLDGERFFYPNPLSWDGRSGFNQGTAGRSAWFDCSCCPVNVVRFVPSIPGFVYAVGGRALHVNLFAEGTARVEVGGVRVTLVQSTRYPWDGAVRLHVVPERPAEFQLRVRIPGWARGEPAAGGLYDDLAGATTPRWSLRVNGDRVAAAGSVLEKGFAVVERRWKGDDVVEIELPMAARRVTAREEVAAGRSRVALARGPVVYCLEAVDHGGRVSDLFLPDDAPLEAAWRGDLLGGVTVLRGDATRVRRKDDGSVVEESVPLLAVPYHVWAHRELGEMEVWIPRSAGEAKPPPAPTIASRSRPSASHVWQADTVEALNDQVDPGSSNDHSIPRHTWWDHRGGVEWVQYEFAEETRVSEVEVYWFDDTGAGGCRVPASWRVLFRGGDAWRPVSGAGAYGVDKDRFNRTAFDPVSTTALRLEVTLKEGFSGGVLEWRVK